MPAINKTQKFRALHLREKVMFVEAIIMLGFMRIALSRLSLKRLISPLKHQDNLKKTTPLNPKQISTALSIGKMICLAANNTPWSSGCLAQSLTAHRMLKKRGIPGAIHIGVNKTGNRQVDFQAHAWSQCDEEIITGHTDHNSFSVISSYTWT